MCIQRRERDGKQLYQYMSLWFVGYVGMSDCVRWVFGMCLGVAAIGGHHAKTASTTVEGSAHVGYLIKGRTSEVPRHVIECATFVEQRPNC